MEQVLRELLFDVGGTFYSECVEDEMLEGRRCDGDAPPGVPASRCQIDHSIAWGDGGITALWNNAPMCQGHHTIKHDGGWNITHLEGGAIEWVSPAGRRYVVEPERPIPVFRTSGQGAGEDPTPPF